MCIISALDGLHYITNRTLSQDIFTHSAFWLMLFYIHIYKYVRECISVIFIKIKNITCINFENFDKINFVRESFPNGVSEPGNALCPWGQKTPPTESGWRAARYKNKPTIFNAL